jgi:hypothetical protein
MLTATPSSTGQNSKSVAKLNHHKNNLAFFFGIVMFLLGLSMVKLNRSAALVLLALAVLGVTFAAITSVSTGISQAVLSTVNFTLPGVTKFIWDCYYR